MAYKVWHSPLKTIILQTFEEVETYYKMQFAVAGHYPSGWEEIEDDEG